MLDFQSASSPRLHMQSGLRVASFTMPGLIAFQIHTNGKTPDGTTAAIERVQALLHASALYASGT